ncbi:uncharacterized protein BDV14DRAFT_182594 [Aspergillus stella-maris]|uniref:uncharacterized protein n=1 Tax=Aspergillus stella-maris TaxID=1810926 RepID=UPI003CCDD567
MHQAYGQTALEGLGVGRNGILQWQVIRGQLGDDSPEVMLEVRVLRGTELATKTRIKTQITRDALSKRLRDFFLVLPENEHLFCLTFVEGLDGFERSLTAGKISHFVDRVR